MTFPDGFSLSRLVGRGDQTAAQGRLATALEDYRRYEIQIDRLHQRHLFDGGMYRLEQDGVSLASLVMHRTTAARKLAKAVASGEYRLHPATIRHIRVEGKQRAVCDYPLLDMIVHGVVAEVLTEAIEPTLSPNLYSYRAGISWADGVSSFARYLRTYRRAHSEPRSRGIYVLRRDVHAYTDSIPVSDESTLWSLLAEVLGEGVVDPKSGVLPDRDTQASWRLLHEIVRPRVREQGGVVGFRNRGVATGQPISCVAFNLYLRDLDHELASVPGAWVARYSDDLLIAHPDVQVARELSELLDLRLAQLDLKFNPKKTQDVYLTGAGRNSPDWPEARGSTSIEFLGMRVSMDGTVALGARKVRGLLRDAQRRARNTARSAEDRPEEERGRSVSTVLNALLDPDRAHLAGASASLLIGAVTDRTQLDWLDHQLARIVASAVSGFPGVAAFRKVAYRRIRSDWGLVSLRYARDRHA